MESITTNGNGSSYLEDNKSSCENAMVKKINKNFNTGQRQKGILLLEQLLKSCHDITFSTNCVKWLQFLCKIDNKDNTAADSLKTFSEIIKLSLKFPELGRPIANSVTSRFVDVFVQKLIGSEAAWKALEILMTSYSGPLATHKETLEGLMVENLLGVNSITTYQADCYALLPSVGGGGVKGTIYKNNWKTLIDRLLHSCQRIISIIFTDVYELQNYHYAPDSTLFYSDDASSSNLVVQLSNICLIIQSMLLGKFPAPKLVPAEAVLNLVCRGLSVSKSTLGLDQLARTEELRSSLPEIHSALLRTLTALIVCCGRALLPSATVIAKVLGQAVHAASDSPNLRVQVYNCLSNWITVARSGCCVDCIVKTLVPTLLSDIQHKRPSILMREKKRKVNEPNREHLITFSEYETVCLAALKTLSCLINTIGYLLSPNEHKSIQAAIVEVTVDVQHRTGIPAPVYGTAPLCRSALYNVLLQLCLEPSPRWPPPTQFALSLLRNGQIDPDPTVVAICSKGMTMLDRIIHPEFSIGAFPVNFNEILKDIELAAGDDSMKSWTNLPKSHSLANIGTFNRDLPEVGNNTPRPLKKLVNKSSSPWESLDMKNQQPSVGVALSSTVDLMEMNEDDSNIQQETDKITSPVLKTMQAKKDSVLNGVQKENVISSQSPAKQCESIDYLTVPSDSSNSSVVDVEEGFKSKRQKLNDLPLNEGDLIESTLDTSPPVIDSSLENVRLNSPSRSALGSKQQNLKPTSGNPSVDSPMELRSGVILGSFRVPPSSETKRRLRVSSISSQSSQTTEVKVTSSPRSESSDTEDVLTLFNDTLRSDDK